MRVLVQPHAMEIGGSQLNAVELAGAVRDLGHEVVVYAKDGPLRDVVAQLDLELLDHRPSRLQPGPATAQDLRRIVRERGIDVVHGYEWPPILEGWAATYGDRRARVVGTVMSMAVADFIPRSVPLVVGTRKIQQVTAAGRPGPVHLMEPPVDMVANRPGGFRAGFEAAHPASGRHQVVIVSRLAHELKLEGILTAMEVVGELSLRLPVRLVVVGDGPARAEVEAVARRVNEGRDPAPVAVLGAMADPRGAYDAADVCLAMGGSALRSLAFAKPLVVQGEGGFFRTLTPDSASTFLYQGWYGVGTGSRAEARHTLAEALETLLTDEGRARRLGGYGRGLVEEHFSLVGAARDLVGIYEEALAAPVPWGVRTRDSALSGLALARHKIERRLQRLRGEGRRDDFNARPV